MDAKKRLQGMIDEGFHGLNEEESIAMTNDAIALLGELNTQEAMVQEQLAAKDKEIERLKNSDTEYEVRFWDLDTGEEKAGE